MPYYASLAVLGSICRLDLLLVPVSSFTLLHWPVLLLCPIAEGHIHEGPAGHQPSSAVPTRAYGTPAGQEGHIGSVGSTGDGTEVSSAGLFSLLLWTQFESFSLCIHLRTIDEQQQQQVKPLTSFSDQSAIAATYVDSPRKVSTAPQQVDWGVRVCCKVAMSHLICRQFSAGDAAALVLGSSRVSWFLLLLFFLPLVVVSLSFRALILGWSSSCMLTGRCLYFGFYT